MEEKRNNQRRSLSYFGTLTSFRDPNTAAKTDKEILKGFFSDPKPNISIAGLLDVAVGCSSPKYPASHRLALQRCVLAPGTSDGCGHQRDARCSLDK